MRRKDFVVMMSSTDLEVLKGSWIIEDEEPENRDDLMKLIEELPKQQYEILKLAKIEGYSLKEIAKELGLSDSNVKVTLHRAVKQLKKIASLVSKKDPEGL